MKGLKNLLLAMLLLLLLLVLFKAARREGATVCVDDRCWTIRIGKAADEWRNR